MDVFEYAVKAEIESEKIYRDLVEKSNDKGIKAVFTLLADMEKEHIRIFSELKNGNLVTVTSEKYFQKLEAVLKHIRTKNENIKEDTSHLDIYQIALSAEIEASEFYQLKAEETDDPQLKAALRSIAAEERRHSMALDELIEFLSLDDIYIEDGDWSSM